MYKQYTRDGRIHHRRKRHQTEQSDKPPKHKTCDLEEEVSKQFSAGNTRTIDQERGTVISYHNGGSYLTNASIQRLSHHKTNTAWGGGAGKKRTNIARGTNRCQPTQRDGRLRLVRLDEVIVGVDTQGTQPATGDQTLAMQNQLLLLWLWLWLWRQ